MIKKKRSYEFPSCLEHGDNCCHQCDEKDKMEAKADLKRRYPND